MYTWLWLIHWSNEWVPYCCASCLNWQPNWSIYSAIRCDKWTLMWPNEYCNTNFTLDKTRTVWEVINFVKKYIELNTQKM